MHVFASQYINVQWDERKKENKKSIGNLIEKKMWIWKCELLSSINAHWLSIVSTTVFLEDEKRKTSLDFICLQKQHIKRLPPSINCINEHIYALQRWQRTGPISPKLANGGSS